MEQKLKLLEELIKRDAKNRKLEAWFYEEYDGVKGFYGTQNIILLGLNPSSGKFPSTRDICLYRVIKENGLENIHISDFIKVRAKNKDVKNTLNNNELMEMQVKFLEQEINIIAPRVIIAMGLQCTSLCNLRLKKNIPIERITHYGYRFKNKDELFSEISNSIKTIKKKYL